MGSEPSLSDAVELAKRILPACDAVRAIYSQLQTEIDRRKPICVASGKCCHFDSYGHRLYVTTLELAAFMNDLPPDRLTAIQSNPMPKDACPLQVARLCSVHAIRPFGCRIFFCDPTAGDWQQQQYERFHRDIQKLHADFDIQYFYVEWRSALAALSNRG